MEKAFFAIILWLGGGVAWPQAMPLAAYVRQIDCVVVSISLDGCAREGQSLFMLYVGSPDTERLDGLAERSGVARNVCLTHRVPGAEGSGGLSGAGSAGPARGRWRVTETDTERNLVRDGPLLNPEVWRTIPVVARHALLALGPDDEKLILISFNNISGSLSIFFHPNVQADRVFHEEKLEILRAYLRVHEREGDVPYERIDPAGTVSTFGST